MIHKRRSELRELITYGLIGVLNTGIHFLFFLWVVECFHSQALANAIGFSAAVVVSFLLNSRFTFKKTPTGIRFIRMYLAMLCVSVFFGALGDVCNIYPIITFIIYCVLNPIVGFIVTKYFVFR